MLQNPAWQATDALARAQLALFHGLGERAGLTDDGRRRALGLDFQAWSDWTDFLAQGPLPAKPKLPEMLLRLGETIFRLSATAEERPGPD